MNNKSNFKWLSKIKQELNTPTDIKPLHDTED